jgi:hypothetical protein
LKRKIFFLPVRWHAHDLNETWTTIEQAAMNELLRWVRPPTNNEQSCKSERRGFLTRIATPFLYLALALIRWTGEYVRYRANITRRVLEALRGDRHAIRRILWRVRREALTLFGHIPTDRPPARPEN